MATLGYQFLIESLNLSSFPVEKPALLKPVTRVEMMDAYLAIPKHVAPETNDPLVHILFALKHEGTNLQILAEALPFVEPNSLIAELQRAPSGTYVRAACYLWEHFTGKKLIGLPDISGPTAMLFDPEKYITGPSKRDSKWRVAFNGLGTINYCATVEKTKYIQESMESNILARTKEFIETLGAGMMDRALAWAYMHETESSYAIEKESPSEDKARMFVSLLHQAHEGRSLSEGYFVELQNSIVSNAYSKDSAFRGTQNWLSSAMRGAAGVTYIPPPPEMLTGLMDDLIAFINTPPGEIDPIVSASIASFGFVFMHPFTDGNGRLSRFLFHKTLCQSGKLKNGLILPVSVAMKNNEPEYLSVLQKYSRPARELWTVRWIDQDSYDFKFNGTRAIYSYWDATKCVEFGYKMAKQALDVELKSETEYLVKFDAVLKQADQKIDVKGSTLTSLVMLCLDNNGVISNNRRKQYFGKVPENTFDIIELCAKEYSSEIDTATELPATPSKRPRP